MNNKKNTTKEIDILALLQEVLKNKKQLLIIMIIAGLVGVIIAINTPKYYTSEVILAPEVSSGGLSLPESLSDMASAIGFDMGNKSSLDAIYPEIYPTVFSSTDFILNLFDVKVHTKEDPVDITYFSHLKRDTFIPFWKYPQIWISQIFKKEESPIAGGQKKSFLISKENESIVEGIRGAVSCLVDKKTSVIYINFTDQDPVVAAIMADTLQLRLQSYITNYRTQKARNDLRYFKKLYEESKTEYLKAQRRYADFSDSNTDVTLNKIITKRDELENEMQMRYNIHNQMATQVQTAQAKVQEKTPAFTIIQRAIAPNKASSIPRIFIVGLVVFMSFIGYTLFILYKKYI